MTFSSCFDREFFSKHYYKINSASGDKALNPYFSPCFLQFPGLESLLKKMPLEGLTKLFKTFYLIEPKDAERYSLELSDRSEATKAS